MVNLCGKRKRERKFACIRGPKWSDVVFDLHKLSCWLLLLFGSTVMAMESQAEALNQLTTDDLEGKVAFYFLFCSKLLCLSTQIFAYLRSLHCSRAHRWMMILRKWRESCQGAHWYDLFLWKLWVNSSVVFATQDPLNQYIICRITFHHKILPWNFATLAHLFHFCSCSVKIPFMV